MDSFFARNRLSAYLDRTLPKAEAEAVSEAIARDISLSADLRSVQQSLALLNEYGKAKAPNGFQARCIAAISEQPVPGSQVAWLQRRISRIPTELVAIVGAAVVVGIALRASEKEPESISNPISVAETPEEEALSQEALAVPTNDETELSTPEPLPTTPSRVNTKKKKRRTPIVETSTFSTTTPLAYRILHGGDQVLYDIAAIADSAGGRLVDVNGKLYSPHSLNEARSFSQLYLVTPKNTAADTHKRLTTRSGMSPYPLEGPTPPLAESEFVFLIEAQL